MSYKSTMCSENDGLPAISHGLCQAHYRQLRLKGELKPLQKHLLRPVRECIQGDGRPATSRGLCSMHYLRLKRTGSVEERKSRQRPFTAMGPQFALPDTGTREQWICWAAGFFDGEGCVSISRDTSTRHYGLNLTVAQVDVVFFRVFQGLFGGRINQRSSRTAKRRAISTWRFASQGARRVLEELLPFL